MKSKMYVTHGAQCDTCTSRTYTQCLDCSAWVCSDCRDDHNYIAARCDSADAAPVDHSPLERMQVPAASAKTDCRYAQTSGVPCAKWQACSICEKELIVSVLDDRFPCRRTHPGKTCSWCEKGVTAAINLTLAEYARAASNRRNQ